MDRRGFLTGSLGLPVFSPTPTLAAGAGTVVLELFTSQGCSSCPPADALLGELSRRPNVIGLAWHVDYWNGSGWRDPYAKREWTERQKSYASHLRGEVYTPALVVNGAELVVGSDRAAVLRTIDKMIPPPLTVAMRRMSAGVEVTIGASATPVMGVFAVYDQEQTTQVGAGENLGRRLVEYRVVREATRLGPLTAQFMLPVVADRQGAVLLVQDASWRVIGAADLPPASLS